MTKMKKRMSRKITTLCIWGLVFLAAATGIMGYMQYRINLEDKYNDIQERMNEIPKIIESAAERKDGSLDAYDKINDSKATLVAYMVRKIPDGVATKEKLQTLADTLDVVNISLLDTKGNIILALNESEADFTRPRFNQLRTVFKAGESDTAKPFDIVNGNTFTRYYAAKINDNWEAVLSVDSTKFYGRVGTATILDNVLSNFSANSEQLTFAVTSLDNSIGAFPGRSDLLGHDVTEFGIEPGTLIDGNICTLNFEGVKYIAGTRYVGNDGAAAIVTMTPERGDFTSAGFSVLVSILSMLAALALLCFSMIERAEETIRANRDPATGKDKVSRQELLTQVMSVLKQARVSVSIVAIVAVLLISYYMQALSGLAVASSYQNSALKSMAATSETNADIISTVRQELTGYSVNNAYIASRILTQHPELIDNADLAEFAQALNVEQLSVYDTAGNEVSNNDMAIRTNIAEDSDANVKQFAQMMADTKSMSSDMIDSADGLSTYQYSAYIMNGDAGTTGFVFVKTDTSSFDEITSSAKPYAMFTNVHAGRNGMILAVRSSDGLIVYPYKDGLVGEPAADKGITEKYLADGYVGYLTLAGTRYFGRTSVIGDYSVMVLSDANYNGRTSMNYGIVAAVCAAAGIFLARALVQRSYQREFASDLPLTEDSVEEGTSESKKSKNARKLFKHLMDNTIPWELKTAQQKTSDFMGWILKAYAVLITLVVVFRQKLFSESSVIRYVMDSNYEKGFNLFSITASVLIICVVLTVTMIIVLFLNYVEDAIDSKARTILKLIGSVSKYTAVIITLYYCLALFGMDTKTLLASAGIIALGVSTGSRELVQDIVAGMFIIFEGQFEVGDVVEVGGWRGTVLDIGVRTTRIADANGAVKNFPNSNLSGLVSQPKTYVTPAAQQAAIKAAAKAPVSCTLSFTVPFEVSVKHIEEVMNQELPKIREKIPAIKTGPVYDGISELTDTGMKFSVTAKCSDESKADVQKQLLRALLLIFEEQNIALSSRQAAEKAAPAAPKPATSEEELRSYDDDDDEDLF